MNEKSFIEIVRKEIVETLINVYNYTEKNAKKFAKENENIIASRMWTLFDNEIENIIENMKIIKNMKNE